MISQLLGNKTATQISYNKPKYLDLNPGSRSLHLSDTQRALLLPQEVIQLPRDEQILLIESEPAVKCYKIKYYEERIFKKRLLPQIKIPVQAPYMPNHSNNKKGKDDEAPKEDKAALS